MPELPEVETTRRALAPYMTGQRLRGLIIHNGQLRWPVQSDLADRLVGQRLLRCERRGKYLLWYFEHGVLLVHLGMSGSLRLCPCNELLRKHDHIEWHFETCCIRLNDPRRFGSVLWHPYSQGDVNTHPLLRHLGIEPFDSHFTPEYLHQALRRKQVSIKQALLNGQIVVGVGNIYCSESLFLAGIHPKTRAHRISLARCYKLHQAILETLTKALESGGSTMRDFISPDGQPGAYFEIHALVYNREGLACKRCAKPIKKIIQNQRATYYCSACQH
ncbi:bifunctional DNA-formamidopyrimidine glycosylase/DNA-(apurinic or apyrimidinic site) lyase [Brackiella oedipodis]|uniref:bifunctional DNA-formamidopyrimidine glycosylase/DNA-(apurinic or apyrimidinic site) lyase n=1 Tax=Brackiella oedipodis TaxID=124225 RepID=UPI00048EA88E|nr:bifunctional DNA-formamidopyrimidine glycosylase/DNA-(apurinic or apyrimidinic site) lyase [Brackiella oedipodis]